MLVAYTVAVDLIRELVPVVEAFKGFSPSLAAQIDEACDSIVMNIGEGSRRHGKDERRFYWIAHGSASEVKAALDIADAKGWCVKSERARSILDRELGLLWGLTFGKVRPKNPKFVSNPRSYRPMRRSCASTIRNHDG